MKEGQTIMIFSYYPGCTLKTKAKDLDRYARKSAEYLGVTLEELPEWQCCGASYPMARDEIATKLSSVRALMSAKELDHDLVTVCSACHNVIKQVNNDMKNGGNTAKKVNNYLNPEVEYNGETNVIHYLEMLRDKIGFDVLSKAVRKPFAGKKIAAYYGCMLLRPGKVMQMDNPENPSIMEDFIRAIGGDPVIYPYRNECCGGYITLEDNCIAEKVSGKVLSSAQENGAELILTACPLCLYNLTKCGPENKIPVYYFTELLAEALGVKNEGGAENVGNEQ